MPWSLPIATSLPPGDGNLMDMATDAWLQANAAWLSRVAMHVSRVEFAQRAPGKDRGMRYRLFDVTLATPLKPRDNAAAAATPFVAPASSGPLCGDNGGLTKKGVVCRRKGAPEHGHRCRQHATATSTPAAAAVPSAADGSGGVAAGGLAAGAAVPKLTLDFGHVAAASFPVRRQWSGAVVYVAGVAMVAPALEASPEPIDLMPGGVIFGDLLAQVKAHLWHQDAAHAPPFDVMLTFMLALAGDGASPQPLAMLPADRSWTFGGLRRAYGLSSKLWLAREPLGPALDDDGRELGLILGDQRVLFVRPPQP